MSVSLYHRRMIIVRLVNRIWYSVGITVPKKKNVLVFSMILIVAAVMEIFFQQNTNVKQNACKINATVELINRTIAKYININD